MEKGKGGPTPLSKPVVKRSRQSPWNAATMVKRGVMKTLMHPPRGSATSPQPARIVSDITEPTPPQEEPVSSFAAKVDGAKREKEQKKKGSGAGHPEALAPQPQEEKMKKKKKQKKRSSGTGHTQAPAQQPQEEPKKPSLANHPGLAGVQRKWEEKEKRDAGERYLAITRATSSASSEDDEDDEDDDEDIPARPPSRRDQSFAIENYDEGNDQDVEEDKDTPEIGGFVVSDGQPLVLDDLPVKDDVNDEDYRDNDGDDDDDDQSTDTDSSVSSHGKADEMTEPLSNSVDLGRRRSSHVPLPSYAYPPKRSATHLEEPPQPPAKRHSTGTMDRETDDQRSLALEKARNMAKLEASKILAAPPNEASQPPVQEEISQPSPQQEPTQPPTTTTTNPESKTSDLGWVKIAGKKVPLIASVEERSYREYKAPDGTIQSAVGGLIPDGYTLYDAPEAQWICPVRDCRKRLPKLLSLGSHFGVAHKKTAFNDNGDATFSPVAEYQHISWGKTTPAVVVSKNPISLDAPPPADPSFPIAYIYRVEGSTKPQPTQPKIQKPLPVGDEEVSVSSRSRGHSGPRDYMHRFLSTEQKTPKRDDIEHMLTLRRQRDLPGRWLKYHHGTTLDKTAYSCALAFMVGDEVTTNPCSQGFKTSRLSSPCIVLPAEMPSHLAELFGRPGICVGCRYWAHLQRREPRCDFIEDPGSTERSASRKKRSEATRESSRTSSVPTSRSEDAPVAETTQAAVSRPSDQPTSVPEPREVKAERYAEQESSSRAQGFVAPVSVIAHGDLDDSMPRMEDWEFAPGRKVNDTTRETIAFSAVYLTGSQPVTISDDISFNRLRIPPGGSNVWQIDDNNLRYCEIIKGKLEVKIGETQSLTIGPGGMFIVRPGMTCTAENRRYEEAVLSCHTNANYSLMPSV